MQKLLSARPGLSVILLCCCNIFFPCLAQAADTALTWGGQLYGGEYYKDDLAGAYGISSISFSDNLIMTGEILRERYHNRVRDYNLAGAGAHLLWRPSELTMLGVTGSHSREKFSYGEFIEGLKYKYRTNTIALEAGLDSDPLTLALQAGKVVSDNYVTQHRYFSINIFYWGAEHLWYVRSAVRRLHDYKEYTLEANRSFFTDSFPTSLYAGTTHDDLITNSQVLAPHGQYNSYYMGCNFQFITTASSAWSLWGEVARQSSDTIWSVELNISLGPGVDEPYISALDYVR